MAGPKGGFNRYFLNKLVLTFGVNHQDLVVGENEFVELKNGVVQKLSEFEAVFR